MRGKCPICGMPDKAHPYKHDCGIETQNLAPAIIAAEIISEVISDQSSSCDSDTSCYNDA